MTSHLSSTYLFGGSRPWSPSDWVASDDRVRGGASQSHLTPSPTTPTALFHGTLDIKTLGGAGFASQRTASEDRVWDLSGYIGIRLDIASADDKKYTFILKDELLPKSPNGREQSTVSWEYDFRAKREGEQLLIRWEDFKPTYRGKEKQGAEPLDLRSVKRISIMMRSFFGTQEGPFSLSLRSICAAEKHEPETYSDDPDGGPSTRGNASRGEQHGSASRRPDGWVGRLFGACVVS